MKFVYNKAKELFMALFKSETNKPFHVILRDYFLDLEKEEVAPNEKAFDSLEEIENGSKNNEELAYYLMEDIIYCSLSATYIEHILNAIKEAPALAIPIIEKFQADMEIHEQELAEQTFAHANYVQRFGNCEGCAHCDNHKDLKELIFFWETGDLEFFKKLFLSMQTILTTMNYVLQDFLPNNINKCHLIDLEEIFKFREFVVAYSDDRYDELYQAK